MEPRRTVPRGFPGPASARVQRTQADTFERARQEVCRNLFCVVGVGLQAETEKICGDGVQQCLQAWETRQGWGATVRNPGRGSPNLPEGGGWGTRGTSAGCFPVPHNAKARAARDQVTPVRPPKA